MLDKFKISLVIAAYQSKNILIKTLPKNLQNPWAEIILIDGFSCDGTKEFVEELIETSHINIKLIQVKKGGLANARNLGTQAAESEFIMHAGPDNYMPWEVVVEMVSKLSQYELVSCMTKLSEPTTSYWNWAHSTYKTRYPIGEVGVVGTPYVAKRDIFQKFRFNEDMLNSDDTEMCHRIIQSGGRIYRSNVACLESGFDGVSDFKERWMRWGRGDALFYEQMKSQWTVCRRLKSMLRPLRAELYETFQKIDVFRYLLILPFLLLVCMYRIYGWVKYKLFLKSDKK